jgi:hypothetical protein
LNSFGIDPSSLNDPDTGYFAGLYTDPDTGGYILVNRGTRGPGDSLAVSTDIHQYQGDPTLQYAEAISAAQAISEELGATSLTFAGHSLGGGLAIAQAVSTDHNAIVFNPAALNYATLGISNVNISPERFNSLMVNNVQVYRVAHDPVSGAQDIASAIFGNGLPASPSATRVLTTSSSLIGPHSMTAVFAGIQDWAQHAYVYSFDYRHH